MAAEPTRGLSRAALIGLALSVVLNLFLAGVLVGRVLAPPPPAPAGARIGAGFAARVRALPFAQRREVGLAFQRHRPEIRAARIELQAAGEAARGAMRSDPYDAPRLQAAFARVRAASNGLQSAMQTALTEAIAKLPASARGALATPPAKP